jgi:RecB family endonuclease NucS
MLVKLPESKRLRNPQQTIAKLDRAVFKSIISSMKDVMNWRSLFSKFNYEHFLSDYVATYPHHVEDGLQPYPSEKVREKVFKDGSRSDVLLVDSKENAVVVECKQSGWPNY